MIMRHRHPHLKSVTDVGIATIADALCIIVSAYILQLYSADCAISFNISSASG